MAQIIHGAGQYPLLTTGGATTPTTGSWIPIHPSVKSVSVQAVLTGSSVGATGYSGTVAIQVSNDGVNALATNAGSIALSSANSPATDGFNIDAHWNFIRASISSMSSGTMQVLASGSAAAL